MELSLTGTLSKTQKSVRKPERTRSSISFSPRGVLTPPAPFSLVLSASLSHPARSHTPAYGTVIATYQRLILSLNPSSKSLTERTWLPQFGSGVHSRSNQAESWGARSQTESLAGRGDSYPERRSGGGSVNCVVHREPRPSKLSHPVPSTHVSLSCLSLPGSTQLPGLLFPSSWFPLEI